MAVLIAPVAASAQEVVPIEVEFPPVDAPAPDEPGTRPLTYGQIGSLSREELGRRLFGEMSRLLSHYPPAGRAPVPVPGPGRASRLDFLSRPRAAEVAGICETDFVTVSYDVPAEPGLIDPPIRLRAMNLTTLSFINDLALVRRADARDRRGDAALDEACGPVDPAAQSLIAGRGPSQRAVRAVADLLDAARAGRRVPGLQCPAAGEAACLRALATLRAEDLEREGFCGADGRRQLCSRVTLRPYEIDISFTEGFEGAASIRVLPLRGAQTEIFRRNFRDASAPPAR